MRITRLKASDGSIVDVGVARSVGGSPHGYCLRLGARQLEVGCELSADGVGWVQSQGLRHPVQVLRSGSRLEVWIEGQVRTFELLSATSRRRGTAGLSAGTEVLVAPMPGTILRVDVREGQVFAAHQPLVIMVSMKMEMTLSVPHPGVIRQIQCEPGQLVERGAALVLLGEADEPSRTAS